MSPAEFIIALADKHGEFERFKAALEENGAEFPVCVCGEGGDTCNPLISLQDSFTSNLLRIIQTMRPQAARGEYQSIHTPSLAVAYTDNCGILERQGVQKHCVGW